MRKLAVILVGVFLLAGCSFSVDFGPGESSPTPVVSAPVSTPSPTSNTNYWNATDAQQSLCVEIKACNWVEQESGAVTKTYVNATPTVIITYADVEGYSDSFINLAKTEAGLQGWHYVKVSDTLVILCLNNDLVEPIIYTFGTGQPGTFE